MQQLSLAPHLQKDSAINAPGLLHRIDASITEVDPSQDVVGDALPGTTTAILLRLQSTDTKIDFMTTVLNRVMESIDRQAEWMGGVVQRISELEDYGTNTITKVAELKKQVLAIAMNSEDLQGCSRLAREKGLVHYQGSAIYIFPDADGVIQNAWHKFTEVQRILQKHGIRYSMLYPAKLKVELDGKLIYLKHLIAAIESLAGLEALGTDRLTAEFKAYKHVLAPHIIVGYVKALQEG
ncbi:hypothetical protein NDU88_002798 [Pleurodeles waltl]|uniref:Uncharacterized protein n=1 Tax=Pleurodeles waltl TaxID=8319 RepID=A0AAV7Q7R0_PLEWA|nr:hypothetical protein NDU88_002798 [Pleurodeles waltl]